MATENQPTPEQAKAILVQVMNAIIETVREVEPNGAPGGVLYLALSHRGFSLDFFEKLMSVLVTSGRLRKEGQLYFIGRQQ